MTITFLGSGSAFVLAEENYHSNILFEKTLTTNDEASPVAFPEEIEDGTVSVGLNTKTHRLLMDAGPSINESLNSVGLTALDIDAIFISHLHGDHCHGLEYLGFKTYFTPPFGTNKPKLICPSTIAEPLWDDVLRGTMRSIQGNRANMNTYFKPFKVKPRDGFQFAETEFWTTQVPHVVSDLEEVPAYGLKFVEDNTKVFITGDTMFDFWRHIGNYEWADVIFHDCEFLEYEDSVHAQFHQLKTLPDQYKNKMWLYHYMLYGKTFEELEKEVLDAGFAGLVKRGQKFDTKTIKEN
jgi:ribonuclease BN (tRNA processing enzyme)